MLLKATMSHLVVFDTNVFVSHFLTPGKTSAVNAAVSRIFEHKAIPVYSDVTMLEYIDVLNRAKFSFSEYKICSFLNLIKVNGLHVNPAGTDVSFSDASDKPFYEAAVAAGAWLVTGNTKHFPRESFIVSPREWLERTGH